MAHDIILKENEKSKSYFVIEDGDKRLAEMEFMIKGEDLIVYHTEVSPELQGQGIAGKLLAAMVKLARDRKLKVVPLCPYVRAQFERHPELYADIWNTRWKG